LVKLRLRRLGKKKQPIYKIVAADSQAARTGKYLEVLGTYDPRADPMLIDTKQERLFHWLKRGAQPSDTVRSLLQRTGLWLQWGLMKKGADEGAIAAQLERWQMLQADKHRREAEKKVRRKASRITKHARKSASPDSAGRAGSSKPAAPAPEESADKVAATPESEKPPEAATA